MAPTVVEALITPVVGPMLILAARLVTTAIVRRSGLEALAERAGVARLPLDCDDGSQIVLPYRALLTDTGTRVRRKPRA